MEVRIRNELDLKEKTQTMTLLTPPLTSPRARYTQADVQSDTPPWALLRANARETAMFRFLGMPRFLFDDLAELMRPHLETYDRSITRRGKPCTFDHKDVLGVCLRYTQLQQRKWRLTRQAANRY